MRIPKRLLLAAALGALAARHALSRPLDLRDRSVVITGGSRGLGLALAREFLARGALVTLGARTASDLRSAQASLNAGERVHVVAGDVTVAADAQRLIDEAVRVHGRLDVLVNNAGIIQLGPMANMTEADVRQVLELNALAPLRLVEAARPHLQGGGRVLIVASLGGRVAIPHLGPYSVSKFAAVGLGQALRAELALEGIGVTTVMPGLMRTGSPLNAPVKGQHRREYALFATLASLPVLALDAQVAAGRIVNALVRNRAEVMVGGPAWLLGTAHAVAPQLTADVMALTARLLPGPGRSDATRVGRDLETAFTQANPMKRSAEERFHQRGAHGNGEGSGAS